MFNSGVIPESWSIGIIRPIYKNKGDPKNPDNYRAITLVSCLWKIALSTTLCHSMHLSRCEEKDFRKNYRSSVSMGNVLILSKNMDRNIKSCVRSQKRFSDFFSHA